MARGRKRASTRWNQGAASVEVKGGRFNTGAAAATVVEVVASSCGISTVWGVEARVCSHSEGHHLLWLDVMKTRSDTY